MKPHRLHRIALRRIARDKDRPTQQPSAFFVFLDRLFMFVVIVAFLGGLGVFIHDLFTQSGWFAP